MVDNKFRTKRMEAGYSIARLAKAIGIPERTVNYWNSHGAERARAGTLKKAAEVLGCKVDDLV